MSGKTDIIKPYTTTGIGSLPHRDAGEAASLSIQSLDVPFWPQLPNLSFRELMIPQYSEGMPSLRVDEERNAVWVERSEEEIERFYESCTEEARVAISEDYARGLYAFLKKVKNRQFELVKGQITGPLTFTLGLADSEGKPVYYDEEMREISLMLLKAKARWQVDVLKPYAKEVIVFIDEPILSALGSTSYMGVTKEESVRLLSEAASAIKAAGAIAGIHCCGRADWSLVMETGVDIINFDAYDFGETIGIYPDETAGFLRSGGVLAWGIVPTTDDIKKENEESINRLFGQRLEALSRQIPADLLEKNIMLTPSCGTGARTVEETLKIFQILMRLKESAA
jgi:hypothetical protein